jgi:hypothetical protein
MLIKSRRRFRSPAAWALVVVFGAPALVEAQQSGLFPNAPINRERVPCPHEDPVYRLYRHQYFGYHPTCWRRFPEGWGCPSPEAPNVAQAFRDLPRDPLPVLPPDDEGGLPGDLPGLPNGGLGREPMPGALPPPPDDTRSPFDLDEPGPARPPAADPVLPEPPPIRIPDSPPPGANAPTAPGDTTGPAGLLPGDPQSGLPELPQATPADASLVSPTGQPELGGPAASLPPVEPLPGQFTPTASNEEFGRAMHAAPARAPQRRGFLGGLFGGSGRRRR